MLKLDICHLYPDLLNLYGDRGNIAALKMRALWRGIGVTISSVTLEDAYCPEDHDIVFLGGGQDYEQTIIRKDLLENKGTEIKNAIQNDRVFLCVCGGYQLLGKYYRSWDGNEMEFLDALDLWTIGGKKRLIGNLVFNCSLSGFSDPVSIVGFENHSGRTYLGENVKPLGRVVSGFGNNGEDGFEGAVYRNTICTYCHGSLLPKNPYLADHILETALKLRYGDQFTGLDKLDDTHELLAHETVKKRFSS